MTKPILHTIIFSTRPGRVGPSFARWFHEHASQEDRFDAELVDLADFGLPVYDEPNHPRLKDYAFEHTKRWSASVDRADAFVFVTPEYNAFPPPSFFNAMQYLLHEWSAKPAGFLSYGFLSGGLRAVQAAKPLLSALKIVPLQEQIAIQNFPSFLDADGRFVASDAHRDAANTLLNALADWEATLRPLRSKA